MFSFTSTLDLAAGSFLIGAAILATGWLYFEFIPKRIGNEAVGDWVQVPIVFNLHN